MYPSSMNDRIMESESREGERRGVQEVRVRININIQGAGRFTFREVLGGAEESKSELFLPYAFPAFTSPSYVTYSLEEQ